MTEILYGALNKSIPLFKMVFVLLLRQLYSSACLEISEGKNVVRFNPVIGHPKLSLVMRKPVYAICDQQRCRSACASAQFDQHLCCSLPR